MPTRPLGELQVSVVGLGCNNFGGRIGAAGPGAVVDAALDEGITLFDTADIYGNLGDPRPSSATCCKGAVTGSCWPPSSGWTWERQPDAARDPGVHPG